MQLKHDQSIALAFISVVV